jgi:hypothetical protein
MITLIWLPLKTMEGVFGIVVAVAVQSAFSLRNASK